MKFLSAIIIVTLLSVPAICQKRNIKSKSEIEISRWSKSVVNIECRGSTKAWFQLLDYAVKNKFNTDTTKFYRFVDSSFNTQKISSGSAIYVSDGNGRYLVTAKHVVFNKIMSLQNAFNNHDTLQSHERLYESLYEFSIKTPLDAALKGVRNNSSGWASTANNARVYIFSSDEEDLAVISLQGIGLDKIKKALDNDGYIPIPIQEIDTHADMNIGDEICAIGYPFYSNVLRFKNPKEETYFFQSPDIVLPVYVFGKVSMTHPTLDYFIADIDGYPGNSGGPIIRKGKIVGIVSSQIPLELMTSSTLDNFKDAAKQFYSRGNLMKIMKPSLMIKFIRELQTRENDKANFY